VARTLPEVDGVLSATNLVAGAARAKHGDDASARDRGARDEVRFSVASSRANRPRTAFLLIAAAAGFAPESSAQGDPFAPAIRWEHGSAVQAPALPRAVAFAGLENAAVGAWSGGNPGFSVAPAHAVGLANPLAREPATSGATGSIGIAAGALPWIFALEQVPAPDAWHRRTRVLASHLDDAASMGGMTPRWTRELPFTANGAARVATDASGASAWVAAYDDVAQRVRVERLDAASGAVLVTRDLTGLGLQEIAVAADGSRIAIAAGLDLHVLDEVGATVHHATLAATTTALALSGDGRTLVHGASGILAVRVDVGLGFAASPSIPANTGELAVCAALDADGSTLAIGWWSANTGTAWRFEVRDVPTATRIEQRAFVGITGGLQDLPTAVALTADGARAAFACWGTGSSAPEAAIWDRASDTYVLEANLVGSAFDLALDARGTRAVVATKSTHANVLSGTGDVVLLDTGERDLQVLGAPRVGSTLHLAARAPGATSALFLFGDPVAVPFRVPGVAGELALRRVGLGVMRFNTNAEGRADWTSPIPADSGLIGTTRSFQAAFRGPLGTRLGSTLLRVRIL